MIINQKYYGNISIDCIEKDMIQLMGEIGVVQIERQNLQ